MPKRNTLICTVGTSLFEANLNRLSEQTPERPDNWKEIHQAYVERDWKKLAIEFLRVEPSKRICGAEINTIELGGINEKLRVLLTEVLVDGKSVYELNAIGQIYLTGFRIRNPKPIKLTEALNKKSPSFRDDHYPTGFKDFVEKVCREIPWITSANSLPYDKQQSIKGTGFFVKAENNKKKLIGTFLDKNNFGARFWLHITDESSIALAWAADWLNQKYNP